MTPQEQQMIDGLIDRIRNTQITDRDPEAVAHLQQGLGENPDAIYILAQTVLVQQQALLQAQTQLQSANAELARLRDAVGHPPQPFSGSWLDRFFGTSSNTPNQNYPPQPQQPAYGAPVYGGAPQPTYPPQGYPQQPYPPPPYPPQGYPPQAYGQPAGGSFLRTAATTAAGVAAGALLFEGVESMFGGHSGYGGGYGHEGGNTIINNYEDRPAGEHHVATDSDSNFYNPSHDASRDLDGSSASSNASGLSPDIEDRRDFSGGNDLTSDDTTDSTDDNSFADDSNSFDDSGSSGDDGGGF
ncbi:MAG: DUF2076 family protein [Acidobacteriaceae bacterium]